MKNLLSIQGGEVLAQLAFSRVLLAFDFDGTLAPIVDRRDEAKMRAKTSALLFAACALYPCAIISGRAKADVSRRLGSAAVKYIVGNHGLEPGTGLARYEKAMREARARLEVLLAEEKGLDVEDKRYSLAVHYRRARNKRQARERIAHAVSQLPLKMRLVAGKQVVNVIPAHAPNKGDALLALRARAKADTALYVGDDVTDEDVFELDQPGRLMTVRIGPSRTSAAEYFLPRQSDIDVLLARLISLRKPGVRR